MLAVAELMEALRAPGDVHRFRLSKRIGHEQHGDRFAVVVRGEEFLPRSVVIVAPTSRSARPASFRPDADIAGDKTTHILVEQVGAVDARNLGELVGYSPTRSSGGVD